MKSYLKNHRFFSKSIKSIDKVRSSTVITDIINGRDINYNELELSNRKTKKNDIKNNIDIIKNYKSGFLFWSRLWLH